ncbi:hypothetical protein PMAYCL1PPCAC_25561 [Pristionchus mayeri]|uniref:Uncharacterized protein n=1 Tax=Pristionchus mayeri TaxID=1317129 RepID=A0AAN5I9V9_9BILA|nr:hypothetical protein PMAYCL1PPCAC_25561 [Pristionchus mayeri]
MEWTRIYAPYSIFTDSSSPRVLVLVDRFQMQQAIDQCEIHLMTASKLSQALKLHLSDKYRLDKLTSQCLLTLSTMPKINNLQSTPEYAQFSDKLKAANLDLVMLITNPSN